MKTTPEILAPVGNQNMLEAAVRSGADAVYLGVQNFNARRNAENFTLSTLRDTVAYCHIRGVKVYLTLNIILSDKELNDAFNTAVSAFSFGIDGIILADLGLAEMLHKAVPQLPLHASTQLTVHSPAALPVLKEMGFRRVVVSREMSNTEIKNFSLVAQKLGIEVEVFVHGALCMCMSGQCYLSALLGGRSGNRGLCAGPCRLPFGVSGGTGYDLSLKDLSLIDNLQELNDFGVKSFKIEGRMKRPEYVAAAVTAARQSLFHGCVQRETQEILKKIFSRSGFTNGYYTGKLGRDMFGVRTRDDVTAAPSAFAEIHKLYRTEFQRVPLQAKITVKKDTPLTLELTDGVYTAFSTADAPEKALRCETDWEMLKTNIGKLGNTPYFLKDISGDLEQGLSVRAGVLNALRRECVQKLSEYRAGDGVKNCEVRSDKENIFHSDSEKGLIYCRFESAAQIPQNLGGVHTVILPLETDFSRVTKKEGVRIAVELPRGIRNDEDVARRLKICKESGIEYAVCGTLSAISVAGSEGFKIIGGFSLNVFNNSAAAKLRELGVAECVISPEMHLKNTHAVTALPAGIFAYGRLPLMLTANCPVKNGKTCAECARTGVITDRLGVEFPVRCRGGFSEVLNSKVIWLADRKNEYSHLKFALLYFTDETARRTREVINSYINGNKPDVEYTRGLVYRGVE